MAFFHRFIVTGRLSFVPPQQKWLNPKTVIQKRTCCRGYRRFPKTDLHLRSLCSHSVFLNRVFSTLFCLRVVFKDKFFRIKDGPNHEGSNDCLIFAQGYFTKVTVILISPDDLFFIAFYKAHLRIHIGDITHLRPIWNDVKSFRKIRSLPDDSVPPRIHFTLIDWHGGIIEKPSDLGIGQKKRQERQEEQDSAYFDPSFLSH